jgi:phosphoglycolate phosphatase
MKNIKAILFDYDDTLVQTQQVRIKALQHAARKFYDFELTKEKIMKVWGIGFYEFMENLYPVSDSVDKVIKNYKTILHKFPNKPYPGTLSVIQKLLNQYKVGVVSSFEEELLNKELGELGFPVDDFSFIQSEKQSKYHKPDPRVFDPTKDILLEIDVNPKETLYIGDSLKDAEAALGAGFKFIGIANRTTKASRFKEQGVNFIKDIVELKIAV